MIPNFYLCRQEKPVQYVCITTIRHSLLASYVLGAAPFTHTLQPPRPPITPRRLDLKNARLPIPLHQLKRNPKIKTQRSAILTAGDSVRLQVSLRSGNASASIWISSFYTRVRSKMLTWSHKFPAFISDDSIQMFWKGRIQWALWIPFLKKTTKVHSHPLENTTNGHASLCKHAP